MEIFTEVKVPVLTRFTGEGMQWDPPDWAVQCHQEEERLGFPSGLIGPSVRPSHLASKINLCGAKEVTELALLCDKTSCHTTRQKKNLIWVIQMRFIWKFMATCCMAVRQVEDFLKNQNLLEKSFLKSCWFPTSRPWGIPAQIVNEGLPVLAWYFCNNKKWTTL